MIIGIISIVSLGIGIGFCFFGAAKPDRPGTQLLAALAVMFFLSLGTWLGIVQIKKDVEQGVSVLNMINQ